MKKYIELPDAKALGNPESNISRAIRGAETLFALLAVASDQNFSVDERSKALTAMVIGWGMFESLSKQAEIMALEEAIKLLQIAISEGLVALVKLTGETAPTVDGCMEYEKRKIERLKTGAV